ncbi:HlyD family secretion protein [Aestuariivirga litoralis]|uniref:HlyD family secretion protein n=1 Tax=Aestuariivirga litoralis TaxID=2650924 RepID=A0A2W2ANL9_9HYPH|nr:HlyD family secretion protein [Aestuariivirga litoralis]PZF75172.1 HlyD family secretion protein [Aestuariivirga litoralis]
MSDASAPLAPKPRRRWLRRFLLLVVPAIAIVAGLAIFLHGGRYISTDNAYVAAQKVLVTPQISGTVNEIKVTEGQKLKAGDLLFTIDPRPYEIALAEARAALTRAETDFGALKSQYQGFAPQIEVAQHTVELRQSEVDRKSKLLASRVIARADIEQDEVNLQLATAQLSQLQQGQRNALSQLGGNPDATLESYGPWLAASAVVDRAQWNLDQTVLKAPLDGIATQVSNIQLGRFLAAGSPVFAIVSDQDVWIDANPKETDITWLKPDQQVTITVDAFPDHAFTGHVASISPGTGAQFSLIPAQNAAGNWVKVVQRVPVRITLDEGQDLTKLRAGMSVNVDIDTHRKRTLAGLLHWEAVAQPVQEARQ